MPTMRPRKEKREVVEQRRGEVRGRGWQRCSRDRVRVLGVG